MRKSFLFVFITLLLAIVLMSCDKDMNTIGDNPSTVSDNKEISSQAANELTSQEDTKTTDNKEESNKITPIPTSEVIPSPTESVEGPTEPVLLSNPPKKYYISDHEIDKKSTPIHLELSQSTKNAITDDNEWFINNHLSRNTFYIENDILKIDGALPLENDKNWSDFITTPAFFDNSYVYSIYAKDYAEEYILNILDFHTSKKLYSLDFKNYLYSPDYVAQDYDYIMQTINWAVLQDNILYVSNSHRTYAKSSNYMNGYITAIDLTTNRILWRTQSLVSNANNFQIIGDVIICGYGFTAEDDFLYQLDKNTGEIIEEIPLNSAPSYIFKKDNTLYVRTYDTDYEFIIKE